MHASGAIVLSKLCYQVGDAVEGQLTVSIPIEGFVTNDISIKLTGSEVARWVFHGESPTLDEAKHDFLKKTVQVVPAQTPLPPGQHLFPFAFPIGANIPATGAHVEYRYGNSLLENRISYTLEASVSGNGQRHPMVVTCPIVMEHPFPSPVRPLSETVSKRVTILGCLDQGSCEITVTADANTFDLLAGVVSLRTTVVNGTSQGITRITFVLCRELAVHVPKGYAFPSDFPRNEKYVRRLRESCHAEPITPGTTKENIAIHFAMPDVVANLSKSEPPINQGLLPVLGSSDKAFFSTCSYFVKVTLQFSSSMSSTVSYDVPISLLPKP